MEPKEIAQKAAHARGYNVSLAHVNAYIAALESAKDAPQTQLSCQQYYEEVLKFYVKHCTGVNRVADDVVAKLLARRKSLVRCVVLL